MRLTASTSTAHIGQVEIRGVQRVMEFEATTDHQPASSRTTRRHHHSRHCHGHQNHHHHQQQPSQAVSPADLEAVQSRTVIVVPCKDEPLDRIMSVWAGIPPGSLIMSVSGSAPEAYAAERDALAGFCRDTGRSGMCVWQRDPGLAEALRRVGLTALLNGKGDGLVHGGKGEALVIGIALAAVARGPDGVDVSGREDFQGRGRGWGWGQYGRFAAGDGKVSGGRLDDDDGGGDSGGEGGGGVDVPLTNGTRTRTRPGFYKYIGFVDADNFVPGSVQEYCKAFSSGLHLASAEDAMVRISWGSKPKVKDGNIEFKKSGRSSEIVNRWFNRLLAEMKGGCTIAGDVCESVGAGAGTDVDGDVVRDAGEPPVMSHICTANAGEHAMTISLALKLRLASGYAIEPFHFLDIFERFAGETTTTRVTSSPTAVAPPASPPQPASLPELGSSPMSSMSSSPLPTPLDCSPVLSASSPAGPSTALAGISMLPLQPAATVEATVVAAMRASAIYESSVTSTTSSPCPPSSAPAAPSSISSSSSSFSPARPATGKVQILQIRTMNPHFHDTSKGESHIAKMWMQGLSAIYHSPVTAGLPAYREALWAAIREGKTKLDGDTDLHLPPPMPGVVEGGSGEEARRAEERAGGSTWEPERCRIYPAPAEFDLLRLRDTLEASEGSFWWSGMEEEEEEEEDEEEEEEEYDAGRPAAVVFGLDGCAYGMSYQKRTVLMTYLRNSGPAPGGVEQDGAFRGEEGEEVVGEDDEEGEEGRQGFSPIRQRASSGVAFGSMGRAVRSKLPVVPQGNAPFWIPRFCS